MYKIAFLLFLLFSPLQMNLAAAYSEDSDGDDLSDQFEQELLIRFLPKFMVSASECNGLPAEFQAGMREPHPLAKNGTIYGQVFKAVSFGRSGIFLEIHYYHLWTADCGYTGHALDVEHISALVASSGGDEPATAWKAIYWYAGAHENTTCDSSHGARALDIGADLRGPTVWISAGKHASFLSPDLCHGGCGGDECDKMSEFIPFKVVNLGEPGSPMNGAVWSESSKWALAAKMRTDFSAEALAILDGAMKPGIVPLNQSQASIKAAAHAGVSTANAVSLANNKTDCVLDASADATGRTLGKTRSSAGGFLKRAWNGIVGVLK
jgi:hypothetical protein